jgi:hypothetical protein
MNDKLKSVGDTTRSPLNFSGTDGAIADKGTQLPPLSPGLRRAAEQAADRVIPANPSEAEATRAFTEPKKETNVPIDPRLATQIAAEMRKNQMRVGTVDPKRKSEEPFEANVPGIGKGYFVPVSVSPPKQKPGPADLSALGLPPAESVDNDPVTRRDPHEPVDLGKLGIPGLSGPAFFKPV